MKKYVVSTLALIAILIGTASPALAEDGSGIRDFFKKFRSERNNESKENEDQQRNRQEQSDALASKSTELRLKLEQQRTKNLVERLTIFWKKSGDRLQNILDREMKMSTKIGSRLERLRDEGKDVSVQIALLYDADERIAEAQVSLAGAINEIQRMIQDKKPVADILAEARLSHRKVIGDIRAAHAALVDVIVSLRGMSPVSSPLVSVTP